MIPSVAEERVHISTLLYADDSRAGLPNRETNENRQQDVVSFQRSVFA